MTTWNHSKVETLRGAVIKTVMMTPRFALGFAGDDRVAGETIKKCIDQWRFLEPDEIVKNVLADHIASNQSAETSTDFLLAFLHSTRLVCIKKGEVFETETAWIGDESGYEVFKQAFRGDKAGNQDKSQQNGSREVGITSASLHLESDIPGIPKAIPVKLRHSMQAVIEDVGIPGVGGFPILLASSTDGFHFSEYVSLHTPVLEVGSLIDLEELSTGDAPGGSYTMYCATACQNGIYVPLIYIPEASIGVVFGMSAAGVLRSRGIHSRSFEEFLWAVRDGSDLEAVSNLPSADELKAISREMFGQTDTVDGRLDISPEENSLQIQIRRKPILRTQKDTVKLIICDAQSGGPEFEARIKELAALGRSPKYIHLTTRHPYTVMDVFRRSAIRQQRVLDLRPGEGTEVYGYMLFDSTNVNEHYGIETPGGVVHLSRLVISGVVTAT